MTARLSYRLLLATAALLVLNSRTDAAIPSAAELLPDTTVFFAEVAQPSKLIDAVRNHPLGRTLQALPEYKSLVLKNPELLQARSGVAIFEIVAGRRWHEAIHDVTGAGLVFAVDGKTEGAVLLARAPDAEKLADMRDRLLQAARDDAERKGNPDPFEEHQYRDVTVYKADEAIIATIDAWLIVTNKPKLGRVVADNLLDGGQAVLANSEKFRAAQASSNNGSVAWMFVDVETVREAGLAEQLYRDKSDNPGSELLVGGVLASLKRADYATVSLHLEDAQLSAVMSLPHDPTQVAEEKEFYFGSDGQGIAQQPLAPTNQLLSITSYRDVGEMWRRRSDLFDENANAELAQADSNLSTVFAGLDFGREVLGALQPHVQIVSAAQQFDEATSRVPQFKLPATAMVFQLKEPEKMQRQLKVSFQSLIGLTNLGAGQNELPQLELRTERVAGGQIVSASYDNLADDTEVSNDIIYNFSPSLGFVGDHFIVSSTRELALELMQLAGRDTNSIADNKRIVNTRLTVDNHVLRDILEANLEGLIAQNMIEKGHSRRDAEKEIGGLLALLKLLRTTTVELATVDQTLQLELSIGLAVND